MRYDLILLVGPPALGGLIAALNADQVNAVTESAEGRVRGWQSRIAIRPGRLSRYVLNPLLWSVVKFCDWTDGFAHRGAKNGARVAATLYLIGLWLLVLYAAVAVVIAIVLLVLTLYVVGKVLGEDSDDAGGSYARSRATREGTVIDHVGIRGNKLYSGTNWFNEELAGRVDGEGNIYKGTNWFNEDKIGRIDEEGTIYKGTSWFNEEKVGRIAADGTLYKGAHWFTEERTGRIDDEGDVYKGTSWVNEEKRGRTGD